MVYDTIMSFQSKLIQLVGNMQIYNWVITMVKIHLLQYKGLLISMDYHNIIMHKLQIIFNNVPVHPLFQQLDRHHHHNLPLRGVFQCHLINMIGYKSFSFSSKIAFTTMDKMRKKFWNLIPKRKFCWNQSYLIGNIGSHQLLSCHIHIE